MSTTSFIEKYPVNKRSQVSIRPYIEPGVSNMGLENYGLALFGTAMQEEPIICLERHGVVRYITGLNEFAPEVKALQGDDHAAKVRAIRTLVSTLEKELVNNVVDVEDKDFWAKVELLKPNNGEFWDKIRIRVGNEPVFLDPVTDPYDLIKLTAIEAGGSSLVAASYEEARRSNGKYKFYLDKLEETASTVTEVKKLRNKALGELEKLFNKNQNKLWLIAKVVDFNSAQYKKSTPNDIIYDMMDKYIHGEGVEANKTKAAQSFITASNYSMEELKVRALVKDATYYKMYGTKADGYIYDVSMGYLLGKTQADVIEYLKNPLNEEALTGITSRLEKYWNS